MKATKRPPYLELLRAVMTPIPDTPRNAQLSLFSQAPLLCMVNMAAMTWMRFTHVLSNIHPNWVIDLRPVPSFDFHPYSRRDAFGFFIEHRIQYRDFAAELGLTSARNTSFSAGHVAKHLSQVLSMSGVCEYPRLAMLMTGNNDGLDWAAQHLRNALKAPCDELWNIKIFPH